MSEKRPSFLRMPGQVQDSLARERRRELEAMDVKGKELLPEKVDLENSERVAESYALASLSLKDFGTTSRNEYRQRELH